MKMLKLTLAALLTIGLVACGDKKGPDKAAAPAAAAKSAAAGSATCESAIKNLLTHYPELSSLGSKPPAGFVEKAEPGMVAACKQRQWKPADLACLAGAMDKTSTAACYDKIDSLDRAHASEAAEAARKQLGAK